jgi:hypothetical protein
MRKRRTRSVIAKRPTTRKAVKSRSKSVQAAQDEVATHPVLTLQRQLGNAAVARLIETENSDRNHAVLKRISTARVGPEKLSRFVSRQLSSSLISRKKEAPSPFTGWAGEADVRAAEAGKEAGGFLPIKVSTDYATEQAERKEKQMDRFRHADIPFHSDNQELWAYKNLIRLRQEYVNDIPRISLAQDAFNNFVLPGSLANKSAIQFKRMQAELGFDNYVIPSEELSRKQMLSLAKNLDEKKMRELSQNVSNKEELVRGRRTEILGTSHDIQAAMQARAAILASQAGTAAEHEKAEINEKIEAWKEGIEDVTSVIEAVSFAGFGAPEAVKGIAEGGSKAIKGGLELGSKGSSLVGSAVEFFMTQMYKEQIEKAQQEIEKAKVAEANAEKMDAELRLTGSLLAVQGQLQQLGGAMGELAAALQERKDYFAALAGRTEKATGSHPGGEVSQYLVYVSQANETASHIETAKAAAETGVGVMDTQIHEMEAHRTDSYPDERGVYGGYDSWLRDEEGPDLAQLKAARDGLNSFIKSAADQLEVVHHVVASLPSPT